MRPRTRGRCTSTTSSPGGPGCPSRRGTARWAPLVRPRRSSRPILGWDAATVDNEVEHYRQRVEAERYSQTMPDDEAADEARLRAPDING